jgi:hypothetical protein
MQRDNQKRIDECKTAAMEIFNQLESQGIQMVGCGVGWADDDSDFVVKMMIHISEKKKGHVLPVDNKGFQIDYEYMDFPQLA